MNLQNSKECAERIYAIMIRTADNKNQFKIQFYGRNYSLDMFSIGGAHIMH